MHDFSWSIPLFTLVDEKNTEFNPITGLSELKGGYGFEITRSDNGSDGKYVLVFQSRELAQEYILSHPSAPRCIANIETPSDAITTFQPLLEAGFKAVAFYVGSDEHTPSILLCDLLQQVRQTVDAQIRGGGSPDLPQTGRFG